MTLVLRTQRAQEAIEGREPLIEWKAGDYAVADGNTRVGRIYPTQLPVGEKWMWFLQTAPVALPPNGGSALTGGPGGIHNAGSNRARHFRSGQVLPGRQIGRADGQSKCSNRCVCQRRGEGLLEVARARGSRKPRLRQWYSSRWPVKNVPMALCPEARHSLYASFGDIPMYFTS